MTIPTGDNPTMSVNPKGEIPRGWRRVRLGEGIREAIGGFACGERDPNGVIQLRMNNVTNRGHFDWSSVLRVPADVETLQKYRLQEGDVLFNNTNSTELVGKTALFKSHEEPVVFSNHFTRLRTSDGLLSPGFLALWLQAQWQRRLFADICNRWIGQSAVHRGKLLALEMPLPSLAEQKRIAAILNKQMAAVERARAAAEVQLEAAKTLPAAYLRAVFNSPEAQQWPRKRIEGVAETCSGATPNRGRQDFYGGSIPWVRTGELCDSTIDDTEEHITPLAVKECSLRMLPTGTLLVAMYGQGQTRGRTGVLTRAATTNQACFAILPSSTVYETYYLQYWFRHSYGRLRRETEGRGGNQPNLNGILMRQQEIPVPELSRQRSIMAMLSEQISEAGRVRKVLENQLEAINQLPAALLRRAFAGEV